MPSTLDDSLKPHTSNPLRLAELDTYGILDTAPEEGFDDVVQIARLICDAPVALVSFVAAQRQWFKARAGFTPCETDLNSSVCAYALTETNLLIIPDLTEDVRTSRNPLVTGEPHIRFYAGAPLRTPSGQVLGSLCVIDTVPRPDGLSGGQQDALRRLARQVMRLLRERRELRQAQASEEQTAEALIRQSALIAIGDRLRDLTTAAEMTRAASEIVGRTLNASRAGYGETDQTGGVVTILPDWHATGSTSLAGRHQFADYGMAGEVLARGEALVVRDIGTDPRTAVDPAPFQALGIGAMLTVPVRERGRAVGLQFVHSATARDWTPEDLTFARNVADRVQVGVARLRAEEQQVTLNLELSHRLKNTLTMVQAIVTQTLRNASDVGTAKDALIARLIALSKAHDILLTGKGESADVREVIRGALELHDDLQSGRFTLVGPTLRTSEKAALPLALMIHELATNAAKYGALSTPDGRVRITWGLEDQPGEQTVQLTWQEQGGPPVTPPSRTGFGSRLIERGLAGGAGGEVRTIYAPDGLVCTLVAPLSGFQGGG